MGIYEKSGDVSLQYQNGNKVRKKALRLAWTQGCSSGKEYCVGDTVITNKKYAMKGSIVGIYPYRKTVAVMFPNGQVSSWKISNLAQVKGCSAYGYGHSKVQFCVDDVVVTNDNPAREGIITGFYPNGMAALTLSSGEICVGR